MRYAERFGKLICLVDTPGLQDISRNNEDIQKEIKNCIDFTTPGPHAVILVGQLIRFTEEDEETLKLFCSYFGENVAQYVIVLFTRFDDMKREMEKILIIQGTSAESQVQRLLDIVDNLVKENGGLHYRNEDYENAKKELQRQAIETKKKKTKKELKMKKKNEKEIKDNLKKQYEPKQQQLMQELAREPPRKRKDLFDHVCDFGRKVFGGNPDLHNL
ncbi:unnamed protein product [Mytilus edulis]|uniref:AIG1-type G domain-containing protein n=1 Tax=Mytilus edulis TaxID=6550 RepID=A0A8S3TNC2_MYTED|nr:unnamed protein product [Mytilus edulis]